MNLLNTITVHAPICGRSRDLTSVQMSHFPTKVPWMSLVVKWSIKKFYLKETGIEKRKMKKRSWKDEGEMKRRTEPRFVWRCLPILKTFNFQLKSSGLIAVRYHRTSEKTVAVERQINRILRVIQSLNRMWKVLWTCANRVRSHINQHQNTGENWTFRCGWCWCR